MLIIANALVLSGCHTAFDNVSLFYDENYCKYENKECSYNDFLDTLDYYVNLKLAKQEQEIRSFMTCEFSTYSPELITLREYFPVYSIYSPNWCWNNHPSHRDLHKMLDPSSLVMTEVVVSENGKFIHNTSEEYLNKKQQYTDILFPQLFALIKKLSPMAVICIANHYSQGVWLKFYSEYIFYDYDSDTEEYYPSDFQAKCSNMSDIDIICLTMPHIHEKQEYEELTNCRNKHYTKRKK